MKIHYQTGEDDTGIGTACEAPTSHPLASYDWGRVTCMNCIRKDVLRSDKATGYAWRYTLIRRDAQPAYGTADGSSVLQFVERLYNEYGDCVFAYVARSDSKFAFTYGGREWTRRGRFYIAARDL